MHTRYDVYLQFLAGANISSAARAGSRLVIPSGNSIAPDVGARFDAVAMQAPDNAALVPAGVRSVLLSPPVFDLAPQAEVPPVPIPDKYFLTVFNPYDRIKGSDDLEVAADEAPFPFVWCHSEATIRFDIPDSLRQHPRIHHVVDATPAQLRGLYENSAAYVSFSRSEGFGWSAADALRYSPAVATRPIGIFSNDTVWQDGTVKIPDSGIIDWDEVIRAASSPALRDLTVLDSAAFRRRLYQAACELET
jgi:hypothetical protein